MSAANKLANDLLLALNKYDIPIDLLKSEIMMCMAKYTVKESSTDIAIYDSQSNTALMQQFLINKKVKGCTKRTIEFYAVELKKWDEFLQKDFTKMEADDIRLRMAQRQIRDQVSAVTINNELRALSSFCTWMHNEGIIYKNPAARVEKMKQQKKKKEAFTELEVEKMRNVLRSNKDKAVFEILLSTGCRVTELTGIKRCDVDGNKIIVHGKGQKDRVVYLNARAIIALENYMKERSDVNVYLFPRRARLSGVSRKDGGDWYVKKELVDDFLPAGTAAIEEMIRATGKRVGVKAHPHKFRRTCATWALKRGMPLIQVSKMLGHESVETTQIYLDLDDRELESAHELYVT